MYQSVGWYKLEMIIFKNCLPVNSSSKFTDLKRK
jgi:hypothetical protein